MTPPELTAWRYLEPHERLTLLDHALGQAHRHVGFDDSPERVIEVAISVLGYSDKDAIRGRGMLTKTKKRIGHDAALQQVLDEILIELGS